MSDTACGKNRLPIGNDWTAEQKQCEQEAWDHFVEQCGGCANTTCVEQLFAQYINSRAQCLATTEGGECGCES